MDRLTELRDQLDDIDQQIATLLQQRAAISVEVGKTKREQQDNPVYFRPEREKQVIENISKIKGHLLPNSLAAIYSQVFETSRGLQYANDPKTLSGKIVIIGLGLIGGSIAANLMDHPALTVHGVDNNTEHTKQAFELSLVNSISNCIDDKIEDADIIIIATPVNTMLDVLAKIEPFLSEKTVITDVGSTKLTTIEAAKTVLGKNAKQFIPSHPLAGTEFSGPTAARKNLFHSQTFVITPFTDHDTEALDTIKKLWHACGSKTIELHANKHDEVLGLTSHFPHMMVFAFMSLCAGNAKTIAQLSAVSFDGIARIAKNSPEMWSAIALSNPYLLDLIKKYKSNLSEIETAIEQSDAKKLIAIFSHSRDLKLEIESYQ